MTRLNKVPRLDLCMFNIANRAEGIPGAVVIDSDLPDAIMVRADDEIMIITGKRGYLRLTKGEVNILIEELSNIKDDIWKR